MYRFLHIVFQVLDDDNGGFLDRVEIREAFDTVLQMVLTDVEFETAVTGMDRDGDGSVSFKEFRKFFQHPKKRKDEIMARRRRTTTAVPVENDELQTALFVGSIDVEPFETPTSDQPVENLDSQLLAVLLRNYPHPLLLPLALDLQHEQHATASEQSSLQSEHSPLQNI